jgi:type IV secretory pathway VirB2 component (pilin)
MIVKIVKATVALAAAAMPSAAFAQANPQGSGPIVSALSWLQGTLLGNVATSVAVIAVAIGLNGGEAKAVAIGRSGRAEAIANGSQP